MTKAERIREFNNKWANWRILCDDFLVLDCYLSILSVEDISEEIQALTEAKQIMERPDDE